MQNAKNTEALATANGHLLVAADEAKKLEVLLRHIQELVNTRINPTGLIGIPMAETVEHHALEIVGAIREANETLRNGR